MRTNSADTIGKHFLALGLALRRDPSEGWYVTAPESCQCLRLRSIQQAELLLDLFKPRVERAPITPLTWDTAPLPVGMTVADWDKARGLV